MDVFLVAFSYFLAFLIGIGFGIFVLTKKVTDKLGDLDIPKFNYKDYETDDGKFFTSKGHIRGDDE